MAKIVGYAIALAIGIYVVSAIVPSALTMLFGANTTGWSTDVVNLWNILPIFAIIGIVTVFVYSRRQ